ncbi:hypothetical protein V6N11_070249 [Hibiscus sabdariffa]|uniref:Uncharacterized protein n=1 Tax=Hibiscus sabdariffa TaxID=183260 RepID=A0ABR2QEF8_9ROSI
MARLSWLPFAFLLVLTVFSFAIQTAGGEGSLHLQGKLYIQFDKSSIVRTRAMSDARRQVIRAHVWNSATIAAKGVCVFLRAIMAIMENADATTISRLRKAHINALDFSSFPIEM